MNSNNEIWLTLRDVANIMDVCRRNIQKSLSKYSYKTIAGNGGKQYLILLTSLPNEAQEKYYRLTGNIEEEIKDIDQAENDSIIYSELTGWQKNFVDRYLPLIKTSEGLKGKELKDFLAIYDARGLSYGNFMKVKKAYKENGIEGLIPDWGKNVGSCKINEADFEYFKQLYLKEGGPSLMSCWYGTRGFAIKNDDGIVPDEYPSPVTFLRKLRTECPAGAIFLARNGQKRYNKKFSSFISRRYDEIAAGAVWVSDHRQLDQAVIDILPEDPATDIKRYLSYYGTNHQGKKNKPVFPWITVWRDFKTGKWLGWDIYPDSPNSDHIFQAFYNAANKFGIPEQILIDNGKDYRSKDFAGGRNAYKLQLDEKKIDSMMNLLNITVHYAKPYNAQAKPIERDFKIWKEWMDKQLPGYRGGNVVERPEKLLQEIHQNKLMDVEELKKAAEYFIAEILHKYPGKGKNLNGMSRDEAFYKEFKGLNKVTPEALKLFCMRTSQVLTIGRNGLTINRNYNLYYWGEWMQGRKGIKVYMRRDPEKYQEAWCFNVADDQYLGKAYLNAWDSPALVNDDLSKQQLAGLIKARNQELKIMESYLPTANIEPQEILHNMALGLASTKTEPELKENKIILNTVMDGVNKIAKEMEKTGTYASIPAVQAPAKKKIFLFESEKRAAENSSSSDII